MFPAFSNVRTSAASFKLTSKFLTCTTSLNVVLELSARVIVNILLSSTPTVPSNVTVLAALLFVKSPLSSAVAIIEPVIVWSTAPLPSVIAAVVFVISMFVEATEAPVNVITSPTSTKIKSTSEIEPA